MAPNHSCALESAFLETNRHSPRIFNKNSAKFDVSTANDKIGFMRSLNLLCAKNTKEFQSKLNWDVVSPGATLPLKECSVVLTDVSNCNRSEELPNNDTDLTHYNNLDHQCNFNEFNDEDIFQKQQIIGRTCMQPIDTNTLESADKIEAIKSNSRKRKSNSGVNFKVTLKIGDEVISKKFCKKKYFTKESQDKRRFNRTNQHIDCEKCNDIKNALYKSKEVRLNVTNYDQVCRKSPNIESSAQNVSKEKWLMAAALVEYEIQRQRLHSGKSRTFESNKQHNGDVKNIDNNDVDEEYIDDAVVSEVNEVMPLNPVIEDDIQDVLRITRNPKKICNNTFQQNRLTTNNNYEIITLDDDCDDLMDDCVIIGESLSHDYLKDKENSYQFYVMDTEKWENRENSCLDNGKIIKRQKLHHLDSEILALGTRNNQNLQSSLSKSYEESTLECNKLV